jgi:hypothetical protein
VYLVWALIIVAGAIAFRPPTWDLQGEVWEKPGVFTVIAGTGYDGLSEHDILFTPADCTNFSYSLMKNPAHWNARKDFDRNYSPAFSVQCEGHPDRSERWRLLLLALLVPALILIAGPWVRRGFRSNA